MVWEKSMNYAVLNAITSVPFAWVSVLLIPTCTLKRRKQVNVVNWVMVSKSFFLCIQME